MIGLPWWLHGKESTCQCRRHVQSLNREDPLEEEIATVSSGKSHGQRSLAGYSPGDWKRGRHDLETKQQQCLAGAG